ncbi:DEAD/DEAH box helicase [Chitinispirillales bacterium ANBcel5]|nr:DEAD/DEAH box helicase [Chitinispirillales bacterium ANBcel5]
MQSQAIPAVVKGKDLLGIAQTGTGKTAAFALPILHRLAANKFGRKPGSTRALVLVPTRELAVQVEKSFISYGAHLNLRSTCIFGGVSGGAQKKAMARGVDILVATPGRLLDLLSQGALTLKNLSAFVLDEADRMLDMGFIHDIRKIVALLPSKRQNLFFSATMPRNIAGLASNILKNPQRVEVTPASTPVEIIDQIVYSAERNEKQKLLTNLLANKDITRAIVFTRTKHGANKVCENLLRAGISSAAIHGNKSQNQRQEALGAFQRGSVRVLVATDIAARGIDVFEVSHVFNYDIPEVAETYVHRIGRTARAGASGFAISFCSQMEKGYLAAIDRLIHRAIPRGNTGSVLKKSGVAASSKSSPSGGLDRERKTCPPAPLRSFSNQQKPYGKKNFKSPSGRSNRPFRKRRAFQKQEN